MLLWSVLPTPLPHSISFLVLFSFCPTCKDSSNFLFFSNCLIFHQIEHLVCTINKHKWEHMFTQNVKVHPENKNDLWSIHNVGALVSSPHSQSQLSTLGLLSLLYIQGEILFSSPPFYESYSLLPPPGLLPHWSPPLQCAYTLFLSLSYPSEYKQTQVSSMFRLHPAICTFPIIHSDTSFSPHSHFLLLQYGSLPSITRPPNETMLAMWQTSGHPTCCLQRTLPPPCWIDLSVSGGQKKPPLCDWVRKVHRLWRGLFWC